MSEQLKNPPLLELILKEGMEVPILEHRRCLSFKGKVVIVTKKLLQIECLKCKSRQVIIDTKTLTTTSSVRGSAIVWG